MERWRLGWGIQFAGKVRYILEEHDRNGGPVLTCVPVPSIDGADRGLSDFAPATPEWGGGLSTRDVHWIGNSVEATYHSGLQGRDET